MKINKKWERRGRVKRRRIKINKKWERRGRVREERESERGGEYK
jgi:hypothetical protein